MKHNYFRLLALWACGLILTSCSQLHHKDVLNQPALLKQDVKTEIAHYQLTYQPLWVKYYLHNKSLPKGQNHQDLADTFGNYLNFVLDVSLLNDRDQLGLKQEYLQEHSQLLVNDQPLPLAFLHEEQVGLSGHKRFLLSYNAPGNDGHVDSDVELKLELSLEPEPISLVFEKQLINQLNRMKR